MLAPLARCDRVFMTICATLSFFSFCQWDVRSSRATIADMLPSRRRYRALSSGMTNCRGTGPPRDLRTTTEFRFTLTEPLMLEVVNEKYGRQSTIRQFPHSFLMILLRRRQSMLETFMFAADKLFIVIVWMRIIAWRKQDGLYSWTRASEEPRARLCLHFLRGDSGRGVLSEWNLRRVTSRTIYGHRRLWAQEWPAHVHDYSVTPPAAPVVNKEKKVLLLRRFDRSKRYWSLFFTLWTSLWMIHETAWIRTEQSSWFPLPLHKYKEIV